MSAFGGTTVSLGNGLFSSSVATGAGTDLDDAAVEVTATKCKLVAVMMGSTVAAVSLLTIKDAALNVILQQPVVLTQNFVIKFDRDSRPELNGLVFDSPTVGASAIMGVTVIYYK